MSYYIPGFRQTHNYFPKEIYFSTTANQVHKYRKKYCTKSKAAECLELTEKWLKGHSTADDDRRDWDYLLEGEGVDEDVAVDGMTSEEEHAMEKADKSRKKANKDSNEEVKQLKITDPGPAHETIGEATNQGGSSSGLSGINVQELKEKTIVDSAKEVQKESPSSLQVRDESTAIRDLKAQVSNLQKQLSDQLATHQHQLVAQQGQLVTHQEQTQRQLEELKNLLLMRPSTA
ncbi:hypothetical protein EDD21DRAFT_421876 [Dissophora ornata]|nr:hypothetical protein EDD21DRAFT_421876 [Dissophora ornata]